MTIPDEAYHAALNAFAEADSHEDALMKALTAALPFLQGVKVKALNWVKPPLSETLSRCETEFGTYRTWTHDEANGKWFWSVEGGYNEVGGSAKDEAAAKSAAQANYEARILSAIEVSVCQTCKGHGIIGGLYRVGDGDVDGWEEACPDCAPSPRAQALEEAARNLIANRFDSYKARNGKLCSIEGDDGEKCWIVSFDDMAELESALSSQPVADGWLPIGDDTPKDTVVLLSWKYKGNWEYEAGLYGSTRGGWLHGQATHWRPLPASPGASDIRPTGGSDD